MSEPYAVSINGAIAAYRDNKPWNGERPVGRDYRNLRCHGCQQTVLMFEVQFLWGSWYVCEGGHVHETTDGQTPAQASKAAFK